MRLVASNIFCPFTLAICYHIVIISCLKDTGDMLLVKRSPKISNDKYRMNYPTDPFRLLQGRLALSSCFCFSPRIWQAFKRMMSTLSRKRIWISKKKTQIQRETRLRLKSQCQRRKRRIRKRTMRQNISPTR